MASPPRATRLKANLCNFSSTAVPTACLYYRYRGLCSSSTKISAKFQKSLLRSIKIKINPITQLFAVALTAASFRGQEMPSHLLAALRAAPYHQFTSTAPGLLQLPTKQTPRANQKTELKPRAITRFDQKPRENKKTETKLRATTLFKRPPTILGGPPGDSHYS